MGDGMPTTCPLSLGTHGFETIRLRDIKSGHGTTPPIRIGTSTDGFDHQVVGRTEAITPPQLEMTCLMVDRMRVRQRYV